MKYRRKKPLYRKVNTKAHRVHHHFGGDYRDHRSAKEFKSSMSQGKQRGLDYTPLFRFLLSKVGQSWDKVHSEAISRLDKEQPIYYLVALNRSQAQEFVRVGESTYYSGMYVDDNGILQLTAPDLTVNDLKPFCGCCTHTFNGKRFTQKYNAFETTNRSDI